MRAVNTDGPFFRLFFVSFHHAVAQFVVGPAAHAAHEGGLFGRRLRCDLAVGALIIAVVQHGQLAAHLVEEGEPGRDLATSRELEHGGAEIAGAYPPVGGQVERLDRVCKVQRLGRGVVAPEEDGRGVGREGVLPSCDACRGQAELGIALAVVAQVRQVVAEEHQQHGLGLLGVELRQVLEHRVGVPYAFGIDVHGGLDLRRELRRGLHLGADVVAVLLGGVGHVVLDGDGVGEVQPAAGALLLKAGDELAQDALVRDPAALVLGVEVLDEEALVRAEPVVDVLAVIEPALPRVHKAAGVAVRAEDAEDAVEVAVHGAEGGERGRGGVEQVRLHTRRNVELRVRRAAREIGHHDVARPGVFALGQGVVDLHRVFALGEDEHVLVEDVREGLVHDEHDVHVRGVGRALIAGLPGGGLVAVEALGLFYFICGEVVAEVVGKAELVVHGAEVVGLRGLEGVVEVRGAVHQPDRADEHGKAEHKAHDAHERAALFRRVLRLFERQQHAQDDEHRRHHNKAAYLEPGQGHVVAARGVRGLLDEGDVPRHEGFAADGELDAVYEGHGAHYESHERGAEEHVPEREGKGRGEQGYGQPVQEQNERLAQHLAQHGQDGDGVRPEHEQRHHDAAREA